LKFNSQLAMIILSEYNKLLKRNRAKVSTLGGHEELGPNQIFYDWQMKSGGWQVISQHKDVEILMEIFQTEINLFLSAIGKDVDFIAGRKREIQAWATVHNDCVSHLPHSHPNQMVSGVYYVKVPKDAGNIVFDDPRGPLPPFSNRIILQPSQGDLVLFPGWLIHQVSPTKGSETRISIAFNLEGNWDATTSISALIPIH